MELEKQVCNLELAKKLKGLGVKRDSYWHWLNYVQRTGGGWGSPSRSTNDKTVKSSLVHLSDGTSVINIMLEGRPDKIRKMSAFVNEGFKVEDIEVCSAFTVAELGEMLPSGIKIDGASCLLFSGRTKDGTAFIGYYTKDDMPMVQFSCATEAEGRAKMLVYLLENKLVSL